MTVVGVQAMMDLEEYREKLNKDPKARRKLAKLEKEYEAVSKELTPEELEKYGLTGSSSDGNTGENKDEKAESVIDILSRKN